MKSNHYISDKVGYSTSLFEGAFGKPVDYILCNWKSYISYAPHGSLLNMQTASRFCSYESMLPESFNWGCKIIKKYRK